MEDICILCGEAIQEGKQICYECDQFIAEKLQRIIDREERKIKQQQEAI
jgi:predicted nucleic acid-binding Zn ribbon protein